MFADHDKARRERWKDHPAGKLPADQSATVQGYNVTGWTKDDLGCQAVSDVSTAKLAAFAHLRQRTL